MQQKLYKQMFDNIDVSQEKSEEIEKMLLNKRPIRKTRKHSWLIPVAAMIIVSTMTVSAVSYFNVGDLFENFYTRETEQGAQKITEAERALIEKKGIAINQKYSKDGVTISFDGLMGEKSSVYVLYTISLDKGYSRKSLKSIQSPTFYLSDPSAQQSSKEHEDHLDFLRYSGAHMSSGMQGEFVLSSTDDMRNKELAVLIDTDKYVDTTVNLYQAYQDSGIKTEDIKPLDDTEYVDTTILNKHLGLEIKNIYEKNVTLETMMFDDGHAILGVDLAGHSSTDIELFLRNKTTGKLIKQATKASNKFSSDKTLSFFAYKLNSPKKLENYELVALDRDVIKIPLNYSKVDTVTIDKDYSIGEITVDQIDISNLSMKVTGLTTDIDALHDTKPDADTPRLIVSRFFDLRMKNGDIVTSFSNDSSCSTDYKTFEVTMQFEKPMLIDDMDAVIMSYNGKTIEIPIHKR